MFLNSRIFLLLALLFSVSCSTLPVVHNPACSVETDLPGPAKFLEGSGGVMESLVVLSQDRLTRDPDGEWNRNGGVYYIPIYNRQLRAPVPFEIKNRDEFPFHPENGVTYQEAGKNLAALTVRGRIGYYVIELYEIQGRDLVFKKRIRSHLFHTPVQILPDPEGDQFWVINRQGTEEDPGSSFFGGGGSSTLLHWKGDTFQRFPLNLERIDRGTFVTPEEIQLTSYEDEVEYRVALKKTGEPGARIIEKHDLNPGIQFSLEKKGTLGIESDMEELQEGRTEKPDHLQTELYTIRENKKTVIFRDQGELFSGPGDVFFLKDQMVLGQYYGTGLLHCDLSGFFQD